MNPGARSTWLDESRPRAGRAAALSKIKITVHTALLTTWSLPFLTVLWVTSSTAYAACID
jgi:hypothetical protein